MTLDRRNFLRALLASVAVSVPISQLKALERQMEEVISTFGMIRNYVAMPGQRAALMANLDRYNRAIARTGAANAFEDAKDSDGLWVLEFWSSREDYDAALAETQLSALLAEQQALIASIKTSAEIKLPSPVSHD